MILQGLGHTESLNEVVLFPFDDYAIPLQRGLRLRLHSFRKWVDQSSNIVVGLGGPGAPDNVICTYYGTVRRVGDELWMWYLGMGDRGGDRWNQKVCLARSTDGRTWWKPHLGLVEYDGSRQNNIVDLGFDDLVTGCVVFHEPDDPDPQRRFKMVVEARGYRQRLAVGFSADGLSWNMHPGNPLGPIIEPSGGTRFNGAYYVTGQDGGHWSPNGYVRVLFTHLSYDFETWSPASCLGFRRDSLPPRPSRYGDNNGPQVHLGAALWNRGNTLLGVYGMWDGHPSNDRRLTRMNLGLVVSHDALHFREPIPDFALVDASEVGWQKKDAAVRFPALIQGQGFENIGDETLFWYSPWPEDDSDGVRLAVWPRDRLGSFEAYAGRDDAAFCISQPITLEGRPARVSLNVDGLSEHAKVQVSILDEQLQDVAGYDAASCTEPVRSGLRQQVRWGQREVIASETAVRIRVDFGGVRPEDVKLYAVYLQH